MPRKGKPKRPILSPRVSGKRFRHPISNQRRAAVPPHPLIVALDLRKGSLGSLNAYLRKHRGIPDREVALELRKLISGSAARTKFRLMVIDHPDRPPSEGGRPRSKSKIPSTREVELVEEYRAQLKVIGKAEIAREETGKVFHVHESTVRRAIRKVEAAIAGGKDWQDLQDRRTAALENLRSMQSRHETS